MPHVTLQTHGSTHFMINWDQIRRLFKTKFVYSCTHYTEYKIVNVFKLYRTFFFFYCYKGIATFFIFMMHCIHYRKYPFSIVIVALKFAGHDKAPISYWILCFSFLAQTSLLLACLCSFPPCTSFSQTNHVTMQKVVEHFQSYLSVSQPAS